MVLAFRLQEADLVTKCPALGVVRIELELDLVGIVRLGDRFAKRRVHGGRLCLEDLVRLPRSCEEKRFVRVLSR